MKPMKMISAVALMLFALALSSCASKSPDCTADKVRQSGSALALAGKTLDSGDYSCGGALRSEFEAGYAEGKRKFCSGNAAEARGFSDGQGGREAAASDSDFPICENKSDLVAAYKKAHGKGLDVYCAPKRLTEMGTSLGEKGLASDFSASAFQACGGERLSALQAAFDSGYRDGLTRFCSGSRVEADAFKDGSEGNPMIDVKDRYQLCNDDKKADIAATYEKSYKKGLAQFCGPTGVQKVAMRQAQEGDNPDFPARLSVCMDLNPQVKTDYPVVFRIERKKYVENRCTHQEGILIGKKDAEGTNQKRNEMPPYCTAEFFSTYFEGYLQGWKETKDKICDVTRAYNRGIDDARRGKDMAYNIPSQCPPEYQTTLYQKYRNGYMYAKNQPKLVGKEDAGERLVPENYSPSKAREACRKAGHTSDECDGVTSIGCVEKGHPLPRCRIKSEFILAVDACFRKGYSPQQCQNVKDIECIEAGKNPFQCGNAPSQNDG